MRVWRCGSFTPTTSGMARRCSVALVVAAPPLVASLLASAVHVMLRAWMLRRLRKQIPGMFGPEVAEHILQAIRDHEKETYG